MVWDITARIGTPRQPNVVSLEERHAKPHPRASDLRPVVFIDEVPPRGVAGRREQPKVFSGNKRHNIFLGLRAELEKVEKVLVTSQSVHPPPDGIRAQGMDTSKR